MNSLIRTAARLASRGRINAVLCAVIGAVAFGLGVNAASAASSATVDLYAVQDAEIMGTSTGSFVNTTNWGSLGWLTGNVNQTGGPTSAQFPSSGDSRGLLKFDLSALPTGSVIDSATVSLYIGFNAFNPVSSRITSVSLYRATSNWTETAVTYDTRPTWTTSAVTSMSIPAGTGQGGSIPFNGYINGNITSLVQDWYDGDIANYGLATSDTRVTAGLLRIYAHEAAGTNVDPRLRVTYHIVPVPEPAEWAMLLAGLVVVGFIARRRRELRFE
jgi:hypothetical protein